MEPVRVYIDLSMEDGKSPSFLFDFFSPLFFFFLCLLLFSILFLFLLIQSQINSGQ